MNSSSDRPSEFALIAQLFAPLTRAAPGAFGLLDDAAAITPPSGCDLVVTADALVEGVHFFGSDPPALIAKKALRVNLSDLAAKGAEPLGYLMALMLPATMSMAWLTAFAGGLAEDGAQFAIPLLGGDTTATPGPLSIVITAFGAVPSGAMIRRAGALPGDLVFVSGMIGDAGGGLALLRQGGPGDDGLIGRYRLPEPRLALGRSLRGVASACCDVSDGLIADLGHIATASGVKIVIELERIPLSAALRALWGEDAAIRAATAGDDYELVFTAAPGTAAPGTAAPGAPTAPGPAVTAIGRVESGSGVSLIDGAGTPVAVGRTGWTHF